ncbi:MAG: peptidase inhibitor family I36 protein [Jatrophihabitans sp.]
MNFHHASRNCAIGLVSLVSLALLAAPALTSAAGAGTPAADSSQLPAVTQAVDASAGTATPMAASDCPTTNFCGWSGTSFSGSIYLHDPSSQGTNVWLGLPNSGNTYSSMYNHRTNATEVSDGPPSHLSPFFCLESNEQYGNLANWYYTGTTETMDNSISAIEMMSFVTC